MKTTVKGQNYNFCIVANGAQFYIEALHLASFRFSFINNLNAILSAFSIGGNDKKTVESQWIVPKKQGDILFGKAWKILSSRTYRDYIEKTLDEDRKNGEWENFKNKN